MSGYLAKLAGTPQSLYDTQALQEKAAQWRVEAGRMTLASLRAFCLAEAKWYERRIQLSRSTPVFPL